MKTVPFLVLVAVGIPLCVADEPNRPKVRPSESGQRAGAGDAKKPTLSLDLAGTNQFLQEMQRSIAPTPGFAPEEPFSPLTPEGPFVPKLKFAPADPPKMPLIQSGPRVYYTWPNPMAVVIPNVSADKMPFRMPENADYFMRIERPRLDLMTK
jgi:hypothetical protein